MKLALATFVVATTYAIIILYVFATTFLVSAQQQQRFFKCSRRVKANRCVGAGLRLSGVKMHRIVQVSGGTKTEYLGRGTTKECQEKCFRMPYLMAFNRQWKCGACPRFVAPVAPNVQQPLAPSVSPPLVPSSVAPPMAPSAVVPTC